MAPAARCSAFPSLNRCAGSKKSSGLAACRLNLLAALPDHATEPPVTKSLERFLTNVGPAVERLGQIFNDYQS